MREIRERGITLIALVITIVVLLILAGITIGAITGNNGIINKTGQAKEDTEIANEKEIIDLSVVESVGKSKGGKIKEEDFQNAIDGYTNGKAQVTDIGEEFEVYFTETNRYYMVDKDGNIGEAQEVIKDQYPGDITVGKDGEELDGSADHPYEINCIEDLVAFSNMTNGNGIKLENGSPVEITKADTFSGKYVVLNKTLNFKSSLSYADANRTDFGDINGNNNDGNTLKNEMITEKGFRPSAYFHGTFDGKGFEIRNIYEKNDGYIGLFGTSAGNVIKNIGITGYMETSIETYAGGLISYASHVTNVRCENCYTDVTIIANNADMVGGLIGRSGNIELNNCYSLGNVTAINGNAGGLIGYTVTTSINNCYNLGDIVGVSAGGILGYSYYGKPLQIINSYNKGKIEGTNAGGLVGYQNGVNSIMNIENSYNTGNVIGKIVGGIVNSNVDIPTIENCYNSGILEGENIEAGIIGTGYAHSSYIAQGKILNCFFLDTTDVAYPYDIAENDSQSMTEEEMKSNLLVEKLNSYNSENIDNFKKWKLGEDGYPTFE